MKVKAYLRRSLFQGRLPGYPWIWSNYSDLTRPHHKRWFSKGNPLISGKSRLVKYYNLASWMGTCSHGTHPFRAVGMSFLTFPLEKT